MLKEATRYLTYIGRNARWQESAKARKKLAADYRRIRQTPEGRARLRRCLLGNLA